MNTTITILFVSLILICPVYLCAQNTSVQNDFVEKIIENIAEQSEENLDYTNLLDEINQLINSPLNLNDANEEDLQKLYLLNQNQIRNLILYREKNGEILSVYELQLIPGFSVEVVRSIVPMICLRYNPKQIAISKKSKQLLLLKTERNIEKEYGYKTESQNSRYCGNPWKYYARYQFQSSKSRIDFGFTAEKDKGEPFFEKENPEGFDYYSAHLQIKPKGFFKQINFGDFQVKFGQGVNLWTGMGSGKSSFTTQNARKYQGIRSYKSTNENLFFRGVSIITRPLKNTRLAIFGSRKKIDATANSDTISSFVSSIVNTGLHRNKNEFDKKDVLDETILGSYFLLNLKNLETGISFLQYEYSSKVRGKDNVYSVYNFSGKRNYSLSFSYQAQIKNIHLFGEAARSKSGGVGLVQGANIQLHPQFIFEAIYRKYDKDYHTHYSNAFGEQGKNQNEEGFYMGIEFYPIPKWSLKAYYDLYEFPWLKSSVSSPSEGHEYFSQLEFTPNKNLSVYFRYKQKSKPGNNDSETIKSPVKVDNKQYRLHVSAKVNENWEIRNRLEFSYFEKVNAKENGFLIYQDLIYHFSNFPMKVSFRYALFGTDSYNTRIYTYENDILYAYSVPAYYNKGSRFYLNLNYKITSKLSFYARYAQTRYADTENIGSGTSQISGDTKSDIKLQVKFIF